MSDDRHPADLAWESAVAEMGGDVYDSQHDAFFDGWVAASLFHARTPSKPSDDRTIARLTELCDRVADEYEQRLELGEVYSRLGKFFADALAPHVVFSDDAVARRATRTR